MYAKTKKITKPIRRKDFYLPSGAIVPPEMSFRWYDSLLPKDGIFPYYGYWKFKNIPVSGLKDLERHGLLIVRRRVEIKAELRKTSRVGKKIVSRTWHLASILESDTSDLNKREAFWNKIDEKLKTFNLSEQEEKKIRERIETDVPRLNKM